LEKKNGKQKSPCHQRKFPFSRQTAEIEFGRWLEWATKIFGGIFKTVGTKLFLSFIAPFSTLLQSAHDIEILETS
jgi:hypothetical protein